MHTKQAKEGEEEIRTWKTIGFHLDPEDRIPLTTPPPGRSTGHGRRIRVDDFPGFFSRLLLIP